MDCKWIDLIHIREVDSSGSTWIIRGYGFQTFHLQHGARVHVYLLIAMAAGTGCKEETRALLGIWGVAYVQSQLDGVVRNKNYL